MANNKMYDLLISKAQMEQESFRNYLLNQPVEEILDHAYEYATREDILMCIQGGELSEKEVRALMNSRTPLADVYRRADKNEVNIMDGLRDCITQIGDEWEAKNINSKSKER